MLNVQPIVDQFGAFYVDEGQNISNVKKLLYQSYDTAALFTDRPQTGNYFKSTTAQMTSVLQPFQKAFTSKGTLTFKPNAFPLFKMKIDQDVDPDDIESSYVGFLNGLADLERANQPLIRYIIEQHLIAAKDKDMEEDVSFGGVFVEPTPNVASPAAESMDGIKEVLKKYVAGGRVNLGNGLLSIGNLATDPVDFCTQIEEMVEMITPALRKELDMIVMSQTLQTRYKNGKRKKYGLNVNFLSGTGVSDLLTIENYSKIMVGGFVSHEGSNVIWATPKMNRIRPIWKGNLASVFKVESAKRAVSIFTDWHEALEFEVPDLIVANDTNELV